MASSEAAHWESTIDSGVPRAARRSGSYQRYVPDRIDASGLAVAGDLSRRAATVERNIRALNNSGG